MPMVKCDIIFRFFLTTMGENFPIPHRGYLQMNQNFSRFFGMILIVTAVMGLVLSIVGLIAIWKFNQDLTSIVSDTIDTIDTILETTTQGLIVTEESLDNAISNMVSLNQTLLSTGEAINSTSPLITTFATVTTEELPNTLYATQTSLTTAQESARLIENVLTRITGIPFFPGDPYRPDVPLHVTLGEVSDSLDPLVDSFLGMKGNFRTTQTNLFIINLELREMSRNIEQVNNSLGDAKSVINEYQGTINELQVHMIDLKAQSLAWINTLHWIFTFGFAWLGFAQIGLFLQGYQLIKPLQ
jgi:methyl-accepting chemotaxis protein